jgi:hypothetical protein
MQTDSQRIQCSQKHTHKNWLRINLEGQKLSTAWKNFSQSAGAAGTERDIAFSQLAVKGLINGSPSAQEVTPTHWMRQLFSSNPFCNIAEFRP